MDRPTCRIEGCGRKMGPARGLCSSHYRRWQEFGDPEAGPPIRKHSPHVPQGAGLEAQFWPKVAIPSDPLGCWTWTAALNPGSGYGVLQVAGKRLYAHRISYEMHHGKIDPGCEIDHICRNRRCVNPLHLRMVTAGENVRYQDKSRKATCKNGHPLSGDNLYVWDGHRTCRTCRAARAAERRLAS